VPRSLWLPLGALAWSVAGFIAIGALARNASPRLLPLLSDLQLAVTAGAALLVASAAVLWVPVYKPAVVIELATSGVVAGLLLEALAEIGLLAALSPIAGVAFAIPVVAYVVYRLPASNREIVVRLEKVVDARPDAVFTAITDPQAQLRLLPGLASVELIGPGPLGKGSLLRARARSGAARVAAVDEVVEFDPPRRVVYRTRVPALFNLATFELEPLETGTRLSYGYRAVLSIPSALLGGFMRPKAAERIMELRHRWLEGVRRELEG
jgi:carbon monoxide dehydrogenase subunit G